MLITISDPKLVGKGKSKLEPLKLLAILIIALENEFMFSLTSFSPALYKVGRW